MQKINCNLLIKHLLIKYLLCLIFPGRNANMLHDPQLLRYPLVNANTTPTPATTCSTPQLGVVSNNLPRFTYPRFIDPTKIVNLNKTTLTNQQHVTPNIVECSKVSPHIRILPKMNKKGPSLKINGPRSKNCDGANVRSLQLFNTIEDARTNINALTTPTDITVEFLDTPTNRNRKPRVFNKNKYPQAKCQFI